MLSQIVIRKYNYIFRYKYDVDKEMILLKFLDVNGKGLFDSFSLVLCTIKREEHFTKVNSRQWAVT